MKKRFKHYTKSIIVILVITILGCNKEEDSGSVNVENWANRGVDISTMDNLEYGKSYLSIYSQIYSLSEHKTHNLTATVSLRNTSDIDTIYLLKAEYFDTHGKSVRTYFEKPIFLAPMETTEIIINEDDVSGGTGSNFLFEWKIPKDCPEPMFEGVMSSTKGQQGLSFTTQSRRIQ